MADAIKVAVRVRPFNSREKELKSKNVITMQNQSVIVNAAAVGSKTFTFDYAYNSHDPSSPSFATQEMVHQDVGVSIQQNAFNGFNGCLFAYGQTGSGKSHSVLGPKDDPGIIPRVVSSIFVEKQRCESDPQMEMRVWIAFVEIYNEHIKDLLHPGETQAEELKVVDHPKQGVYIPGCTEAPCKGAADVDKLLDFGTKRRAIAATNMNATSSRSHAVFTIKIERLEGQYERGKEDTRTSTNAKVNLVDLAGSERSSKTGATGATLKEGCAINQSLSALGMVIKELSEAMAKAHGKGKTEHVPFRSSKLTFLLKDSLSGNSKTYMMAAISPAEDNAEETISTLRFASSVKKIKTVAKQNVDKKDEMIKDMMDEIKRLKAKIGDGGGGEADAAVSEEISNRQHVMKKLSRSYSADLAEAAKHDELREDALKNMGLGFEAIEASIGLNKDTPFLLNLNPDPMLAGCVMYFLKEGERTTVGSEQDNTIKMKGLGITAHICEFTNTQDREVSISLATPSSPTGDPQAKPGRVTVNGQQLKLGTARTLLHGDRIVFGRSFACNLQIPAIQSAHQAEGDTEAHRESFALSAMIDEGALLKELVPEDSSALGEVQYMVEEAFTSLGDRGADFLRALEEMCHLVDEANEITTEMRPEENLKFEVEFMKDMYNETGADDMLVVRLLESTGGAAKVLYYWHTRKFKERLEMMRDAYHAFHNNPQGKWPGMGNSLEDPWKEPDMAQIQELLHSHARTAVTDVSVGVTMAQVLDGVDGLDGGSANGGDPVMPRTPSGASGGGLSGGGPSRVGGGAVVRPPSNGPAPKLGEGAGGRQRPAILQMLQEEDKKLSDQVHTVLGLLRGQDRRLSEQMRGALADRGAVRRLVEVLRDELQEATVTDSEQGHNVPLGYGAPVRQVYGTAVLPADINGLGGAAGSLPHFPRSLSPTGFANPGMTFAVGRPWQGIPTPMGAGSREIPTPWGGPVGMVSVSALPGGVAWGTPSTPAPTPLGGPWEVMQQPSLHLAGHAAGPGPWLEEPRTLPFAASPAPALLGGPLHLSAHSLSLGGATAGTPAPAFGAAPRGRSPAAVRAISPQPWAFPAAAAAPTGHISPEMPLQ